MNKIPRKALILVGFALVVFFALAFAVSNSQRGEVAGQFLNVPANSLSTPVMSSQTVVPDQSSQPDPKVFETMISLPSQSAQGRPAITGPVDDVSIRNYIGANPSVAGVAAQNVQVASIQYLSARNLETVLNNSDPFWSSFPPDEPLAYVVLSGEFIAEIDPSVQGSDATITYHTAYRVFSVRTGNELGGKIGPK